VPVIKLCESNLILLARGGQCFRFYHPDRNNQDYISQVLPFQIIIFHFRILCFALDFVSNDSYIWVSKTLTIMRKTVVLLIISATISSCTVTIPMQTSLSDQTLLLAENKNIKANYVVSSNVPDGFIRYVGVMKNGSETVSNESHKYAIETAFRKLWDNYFSSKFNAYAKDEMVVRLILEDFELRTVSSTSIGETMFTGNAKSNVEAIAVIDATIIYHGLTYQEKVTVSSSDYQETQAMSYGNTYYTSYNTNPTQQKAQIIDECLNKGVVRFENFIRQVLMADQE